ncbi:Kelch repeat-containing protein [Streptomyces sp. YKOK-I1]
MPPIRTIPGRWRARCTLTGILAAVAVLCGMLPAGAGTGLNWATLPSVPTARFDLGAAAAPCPRGQTGSCLYAIGGYGTGFLATVQAYNQRTNAWSTLPNLPSPRSEPTAAAAPCPDGQSGTCVYALGGADTGGVLPTAQSYNPATSSWTTVTALRTARYGLGAASAPCPGGQGGTCVYAVGGYARSGVTASVETFDPVSRTWTTLASLPTARYALGAAAAPCPPGQKGTCVYAVGGIDSRGRYLGTVESYNPATRAWSTVASLPVPRGALGVAATTCPPGQTGTCVYAVTGLNNGGALADAESYNPASGFWTTLPSAPTRRYSAAAAALPCPPGENGNCVYVVGGIRNNALATLEALDPPLGSRR